MPTKFALSSVTGIMIAGAGLGLYLGKAAISEINPAYFNDPVRASTFHANLVANPPSLDDHQPLLETAGAFIGLGDGCVGCRSQVAEYYSAYEPSAASYGSSYSTYRTMPVETVLAEAEQFVSERPSQAELDRIQRYAHYRVSHDEKPVTTVSAKPAEDEGTYTGVGGPEEAEAPTEAEATPAA